MSARPASWVLLACLTVLVPACARSDQGAPAQGQRSQTNTAPAAARSAQPAVTATALPDFTALVREYGDAVVNIVSTRENTRPTASAPHMSPDDSFNDFFKRFGIPMPGAPGRGPGRGATPQIERGEGSGFIITTDGYVLTNAHVVDDSSKVQVKLSDRREFDAKVVGKDLRSDVAVLKIDARNLPIVKFGDSSKLQPGQWVAAIGAPFGFENSVTVGVVSATSRSVGSENSIVPFIQTDVAVNPGNSGGPLFDLAGEVIGINSMIYSGNGGYQGISFAIPIDAALDVEKQLLATGHVTRGRIGVAVQEVNASLAHSFGLDRPRGALISAVDDKGPAAAAGLRAGDIIVAVDRRPIELSTQLPAIVARLLPGRNATLNIIRDGRASDIRYASIRSGNPVRRVRLPSPASRDNRDSG